MKEHPILFSDPMVRAILEGRKTQTRRVMKPQPVINKYNNRWFWACKLVRSMVYMDDEMSDRTPWEGFTASVCPYGQPGDRLWVREAHALKATEYGWMVRYRADGSERTTDCDVDEDTSDRWDEYIGRPSIHMFRWASRIMLEVTGVRAERVQDISEADARAEGVEPLESRDHEDREDFDHSLCQRCGGRRLHASLGANLGVIFDNDCQACTTHRDRFRYLWESTYGDNVWDRNDWVWVIEFKRAA